MAAAAGSAAVADRPLVARITKLFNLLDQDGNGTLDVKELKFFVRKVILGGGHEGEGERHGSRQLATKLLKTLDQDGDRNIDVLEFVEGLAVMDEFAGAPLDKFLDDSLAAAAKHLAAAEAKIADLAFRVFRHLDADESKTLGIKEIKHFYRRIVGMEDKEESRAAAVGFMKSLDRDGSHTLDPHEFEAGFLAMNRGKAIATLTNAVEVIEALVAAKGAGGAKKSSKGKVKHGGDDAGAEAAAETATAAASAASAAAAGAIEAATNLQRLRWLFALVNTSQSGGVTKDEFCSYLRDSVGMDATAASTSGAALFSQLDANADHALSVMEFVFGLRQMPASLRRAMLDTVPPALPADVVRAHGAESVPGALKTLFAQMDSDGDGFLGIKELKALFRRVLLVEDTEESRRLATDFMRLLDRDGDHKVTQEEFAAALEVHDGHSAGSAQKLLAQLITLAAEPGAE